MMFYKCPVDNCDKVYHRPFRLQDHINSHTGRRSYTCEEKGCDKAYTTHSHLLRHIRSIHKKQSSKKYAYSCGFKNCDHNFETEWGLDRHYKRTHYFSATCEECNRVFENRTKLAGHLKQHRKRRHCDVCGQDLGIISSLEWKKHKSSHNVIECGECKQRFPSIKILEKHLVSHFNEFTCAHCEKTLKSKKSLLTHILNFHSSRSSFHVCDEKNCTKVFLYKKNLVQHKRTFHSEDKPECKLCGKIFMYKHTFQRHIELHKENKIISREKKMPKNKDLATAISQLLCTV